MRKIFHKLWKEIKRGENIDQYITIIAAFLLAGLNLAGLTSISLINSLTLAILGLLVISSLVNRHQIKNVLSQLSFYNDKDNIRKIVDIGFNEYYNNRGHSDLIGVISNAKTKLDFLGISLPDMSSDRAWSRLNNRLLNNPSLKVRILLLNPYSVLTLKKRQIQFYKSANMDIVSKIWESIDKFKSIFANYENENVEFKSRFDVRLYSNIPTTSCVFNEDLLNISYYDEAKPASLTPAWIFLNTKKDTSIYQYYQKNFNLIWKNAISVFDNDYKTKVMQESKFEIKEHLKSLEKLIIE